MENEFDNFKEFKLHVCVKCTANDAYCPSNCDLLEKARKMPLEIINQAYSRHGGDMQRVCRYIKQYRIGR